MPNANRRTCQSLVHTERRRFGVTLGLKRVVDIFVIIIICLAVATFIFAQKSSHGLWLGGPLLFVEGWACSGCWALRSHPACIDENESSD